MSFKLFLWVEKSAEQGCLHSSSMYVEWCYSIW